MGCMDIPTMPVVPQTCVAFNIQQDVVHMVVKTCQSEYKLIDKRTPVINLFIASAEISLLN